MELCCHCSIHEFFHQSSFVLLASWRTSNSSYKNSKGNVMYKHKSKLIKTTRKSLLTLHPWRQMARNNQQWKSPEEDTGTEDADSNKWKCIGHTSRKQRERVTRQALFWNPQGKRKRGRPKNNWRRSAEQELQQAGIKWNELELRAQDRYEWRNIVDALCFTEERGG